MPNPITFPQRLKTPLAFVGVSVLTMTSKEVLANQTVLVEDGRIKSIRPADRVGIEGAVLIDGSGKYLMPGLADMHVHYWDQSEASMFLANGVTTVRNMWGSPLHRVFEEENRRGEWPGPRIITTSPLIDGLNDEGKTLWNNSNYVEDPERARQLVRRYAEQGYNQIKVYSQLRHDTLAALGRAADENGVKLVGHCPNPMTFEEAIGAGMKCFEHLTNVFFGHFNEGVSSKDGRWTGEKMIELLKAVVEETDFVSIRRLAALMAEKEIWNCPTITVWQGGVPNDSRAADSRMNYMPSWFAGWWNQSRYKENKEEIGVLLGKAVDQRIKVLSILREEGAPVMVGTDTPNPFCFQGFSLHDEMENFLEAGYSAYETLRIATVDAARFAGELDQWGSIEEGKRADLILVDANPLQDLGVLRNPEAVLSNGYYFSRAALEDLLAQRSKKVKELPPPADVHVENDSNARHLTENQAGSPTGKICCNTVPQPGGGLEIEEKRSSSNGSVTTRRIFLGPDKRLQRAKVDTETDHGIESFEVVRKASGYEATVTTVDGFQHRSELGAEPLFPSDVFGIAAVAEVLAGIGDETTIRTLSVDHEEATVIEAILERNNEGEIRITFKRPGTPSEQNYRIDAEGNLLEVRDDAWGPRKVTLDEGA